MKRYLFIFILLALNSRCGYAQRPTGYYLDHDHEYRDDNLDLFNLNNTAKSNSTKAQKAANIADDRFMLYAMQKLWHEDTNGLKGYRVNIANCITDNLWGWDINKDALVRLLGKPDSTNEQKVGNADDYLYVLYKADGIIYSFAKFSFKKDHLYYVEQTPWYGEER